MKVGITLPQIGEQATKENVINLSKTAEKEGFLDISIFAHYKRISIPLSVFKLDNGIPQNPPAELPLKTYNVKIEDNGVYILIDDVTNSINCL